MMLMLLLLLLLYMLQFSKKRRPEDSLRCVMMRFTYIGVCFREYIVHALDVPGDYRHLREGSPARLASSLAQLLFSRCTV